MQEVIIYRSPLEAAFWHSMMNGGAVIFLAILALGILWAVVYSQWDALLLKLAKRNRQPLYQYRQRWWALSSGKVATAVTVASAIGLHFWYIS